MSGHFATEFFHGSAIKLLPENNVRTGFADVQQVEVLCRRNASVLLRVYARYAPGFCQRTVCHPRVTSREHGG